MRSLLGLSFVILVLFVGGCSNACPPPVFCSQPHPDNCPCNIDDAGSTPHVDAYVAPDAYVEPTQDADVDANPSDAGLDDTGVDAG